MGAGGRRVGRGGSCAPRLDGEERLPGPLVGDRTLAAQAPGIVPVLVQPEVERCCGTLAKLLRLAANTPVPFTLYDFLATSFRGVSIK